MQLSSLSGLFVDRERELKQLIANLQINEVKDDNKFTATINRIKQQLLLTPVSIGEPKITGNQAKTQQVPPNYQNMWGGQRTMNVITVEFPFTGSAELFNYRSNGGSLSMHNIYLPSYNSISLDVQLAELNKEKALAKAKEEMATTLEVINQNNPDAERWSATQSVLIEQMADKKRKELLAFYS